MFSAEVEVFAVPTTIDAFLRDDAAGRSHARQSVAARPNTVLSALTVPGSKARQQQGSSRHMLGPTAHLDTFTRDNLPSPEEWPNFLLEGFDYPDHLNAAVELTDAMVAKGYGDRTALIGNGRRRTYKELSDWTNRLAHALVENYGVKPGNRVLIRSANNPAMVACWLAATKAGAVVVNTMPSTRPRSAWRSAIRA
jgi:non-ribosomal peptide synthetase component F